jgi:hypothetical protein
VVLGLTWNIITCSSVEHWSVVWYCIYTDYQFVICAMIWLFTKLIYLQSYKFRYFLLVVLLTIV